MTHIPYAPMWAWNLMGEDQVFFSQPTEVWFPGEALPRAFPHALAVARCTEASQIGTPGHGPAPLTDRAGWSFPVQCGWVASPAPDGRYLCVSCRFRYTCSVCQHYTPAPTWPRQYVTCCSDHACLAIVDAPPVPCVQCGTLLLWEERFSGACWDCHTSPQGA